MMLKFIQGVCLLLVCHFVLANNVIVIRNYPDDLRPRPPNRWLIDCQQGNASVGLTNHLAEKLFKEMGYEVEWFLGGLSGESSREEFAKPIEQLRAGETAFMITPRDLSLTYSDVVRFSVPLVYQRTSLITLVKRPIYNGRVDSLQPYIGGAFGTGIIRGPFVEFMERHKLTIQNFDSEYGAIDALVEGAVDYVVSDHNVAKRWELEKKKHGQLLFGEIIAPSRGVYLVAIKDGPYAHLFEEINRRLTGFQVSGLVDHLREAYLKQWLANPCE